MKEISLRLHRVKNTGFYRDSNRALWSSPSTSGPIFTCIPVGRCWLWLRERYVPNASSMMVCGSMAVCDHNLEIARRSRSEGVAVCWGSSYFSWFWRWGRTIALVSGRRPCWWSRTFPLIAAFLWVSGRGCGWGRWAGYCTLSFPLGWIWRRRRCCRAGSSSCSTPTASAPPRLFPSPTASILGPFSGSPIPNVAGFALILRLWLWVKLGGFVPLPKAIVPKPTFIWKKKGLIWPFGLPPLDGSSWTRPRSHWWVFLLFFPLLPKFLLLLPTCCRSPFWGRGSWTGWISPIWSILRFWFLTSLPLLALLFSRAIAPLPYRSVCSPWSSRTLWYPAASLRSLSAGRIVWARLGAGWAGFNRAVQRVWSHFCVWVVCGRREGSVLAGVRSRRSGVEGRASPWSAIAFFSAIE